MGEVTWGIGCTLDGRCGHEDGVPDEEQHREAANSFRGFDALVMGRVTFELMFPFWADLAREQSASPALNEFAVAMTEISKVVFSRTLDEAGWNTRLVSSSPLDEVRRLRDEGEATSLSLDSAVTLGAGHLVLDCTVAR